MAKGQNASPFKIERLQQAASYFANLALVSKGFFACQDWEDLDADQQKGCAWSSLERFVQKAWRRPAKKEELARLQTFFNANWGASKPADAVRLTVMGVLQTPAFLYRLETGNTSAVKDKAVPLTSW